ncbi:hypothetical protein ACOSP7_002379 [Xanthoceras sorbifolium]
MGVPNGGQTIHMDGEHPSLSEWASTFSVNGRGIYINQIETCLKEMTSSDAEFKITFYLFLLGSLLAPGTSNFLINLMCVAWRWTFFNMSQMHPASDNLQWVPHPLHLPAL